MTARVRYTFDRALMVLAEYLLKHDWTLWGYQPPGATGGRWAPAVACRGHWTFGIRIGRSEMTWSGRREIEYEAIAGHACRSCGGSGVHPVMGMWNLAAVRRDPVAYAKAALEFRHGRPFGSAYEKEGAVVLEVDGKEVFDVFPLAPSMRPFRDDGEYRCPNCTGAGRGIAHRVVNSVIWPTFGTTPIRRVRGLQAERKDWHLERNGVCVASGALPLATIYSNPNLFYRNLRMVMVPYRPPPVAYVRYIARAELHLRRRRVVVRFPRRPDNDIRRRLKEYGFRYNPRTFAWWSYRQRQDGWPSTMRIARAIVAECNRRAECWASLQVLGGPAGGGVVSTYDPPLIPAGQIGDGSSLS